MSKYQDTIKSLPVDNEPVENPYVCDSLFPNDPTIVSTIAAEFKESVLIVVLFVLFSSEQLTDLIRKYIPIADKSPFALMAIKCVTILVLYYIIRNFQLIRK